MNAPLDQVFYTLGIAVFTLILLTFAAAGLLMVVVLRRFALMKEMLRQKAYAKVLGAVTRRTPPAFLMLLGTQLIFSLFGKARRRRRA